MFKYDEIVCPYCHGKKLPKELFPNQTFKHTEVHFRMETYFEDESELNDEGKSMDQIRRMPESPAKARLMEQTNRNAAFLCRDDARYNNFWDEFGGTTEENYGQDKKLPFKVYQLPILDPSVPAVLNVLQQQRPSANGSRSKEDYFLYDGDGMVMGIVDMYGHSTYRRLCPGCHNPLPLGYGKYNAKFISVIGVTNSGKTVYISQLLDGMTKYAQQVDLNAFFTSDHEPGFVENNPVRYNEPLPRPTMAGKLSQPMFYDLVQTLPGDKLHTDTIVIYDIAGENCANANDMMKYGDFVTRSDGIILLLDPSQLGFGNKDELSSDAKSAKPSTVLNTIHGAFKSQKTDGKLELPIAVCISKSDMIEGLLPAECRKDTTSVLSSSQLPMRKFNASEYNVLECALVAQMRAGVGAEVDGVLRTGYKHYNYFAFTATGCAVEKRNNMSYPVAPPMPRRIAEPLLWLFYQFGYIGSDVPIRLPCPRPMPECIMEPTKKILGIFGGKPVARPLTEEEKESYWYEIRT